MTFPRQMTLAKTRCVHHICSGAARAAWLQRVKRSVFTGRPTPLRYKHHLFSAKVDGVSPSPRRHENQSENEVTVTTTPQKPMMTIWKSPALALAVAVATIAAFAGSSEPIAADERQPNIVLIMADDLGIEGLGCYGGLSYAMPNLDQLAAEGLRFSHAHAQPLCANTRMQLMTGMHNDRNWICFGIMDPAEKTFGHYLQDVGYKTCIAGKWQLQSYDPPDYPGAETRRGIGMHPKDSGFDSYALYHSLHTEDKGSRYANPTWLEDGTLKKAEGQYGPDRWVDYINTFMEREKANPFFVYYPMALPHWPMNPTPDSADWSDPAKRLDEDPRYFKDMVEYMDKCVGKIVQKIDDLGLRENTLILFYSDNGTHLSITSQTKNGPVAGGKGLPTDAGTHVPLIVTWPGKVQPGVSDALVDSTDFIPTMMQAAGHPLPSDHALDGISFYPELVGEGTTSPRRQWIYSFYDPRPGWDKDHFTRHVSARDRRWHLYQTGQLFDVEADVLEQHPITAENDTAETAAVRKRLAAVLESQSQSDKNVQ
ncbi:sulfatase-like hydrolase/transferase [Novipirellula rosea]|uniref:Sulfatase-like hydrolase/transferase n=2 Tax=Novipirellula rosea TaxID=1031540 RepID=A0ABP8N2F5_9BACT